MVCADVPTISMGILASFVTLAIGVSFVRRTKAEGMCMCMYICVCVCVCVCIFMFAYV